MTRALIVRVGALFLAVAIAGGCAPADWGADEGIPAGGYGRAKIEPASSFAWPGAVREGVPMIRVGLGQLVSDAVVTSAGECRVIVFADSVREWRSPAGALWRFVADGDGAVRALGSDGVRFDGAGTVRIRPNGDSPLAFMGTRYRGEMEVFAASPGSLSVVNIVDVESYLRGVVPEEIGHRSLAELEAVKAQAVAARTYAVAASGRRARGDFDVFATVEDQVYGGVDVEDPVCDRAVSETAGVIVEYDGRPIHAYFHANCGGRTEGRHEVWELPRLPYLTSVWDTPGGTDQLDSAYCHDGRGFTWTETWTGGEIRALVQQYLPSLASTPVTGDLGAVRDIRVTARSPSGRVRWLEVETAGGTYRVFGDSVRRLLRRPGSGQALWSSWFTLDVYRRDGMVARVVANGRGYGHGVGMCQHGALEMARDGFSYTDILKHYYRGVEIVGEYGARGESR